MQNREKTEDTEQKAEICSQIVDSLLAIHALTADQIGINQDLEQIIAALTEPDVRKLLVNL